MRLVTAELYNSFLANQIIIKIIDFNRFSQCLFLGGPNVIVFGVVGCVTDAPFPTPTRRISVPHNFTYKFYRLRSMSIQIIRF